MISERKEIEEKSKKFFENLMGFKEKDYLFVKKYRPIYEQSIRKYANRKNKPKWILRLKQAIEEFDRYDKL